MCTHYTIYGEIVTFARRGQRNTERTLKEGDTMTMYAIVGIKKLKTAGNIQGAIDHATRKRFTANSNGKTNDVMIEPPALDELMKDIQACHVRKNSVLCIELMLTASPEYFEGKTEEQVKAWEEKSLAWAKDYFGADNIRMCICHRDELTPHLSILACPIVLTANGERKLNARAFTGGREKLRAMWTGYAQAMKPLGLERGREFSPARHQDVKAYYHAVKQAGKQSGRKNIRADELPAPELRDRMHPREYASTLVNRVISFYRKENGALRTALAEERNRREEITRQVIQDRQFYEAMKENPSAFKEMQEALATEVKARAKDRRELMELMEAIRTFFRKNISRNSPMRKPEKLGALTKFKELKKDISLSLGNVPAQDGLELTRG